MERKYWMDARARGKTRFIWRQMLYSLAFWLIVIPLLDLLAFKTNPLSIENIVIGLILMPIFVLGGWLEAIWRWKDLERKYPADCLPVAK